MEALREEIYDYTSDPAQESFRNQQYQRSSMQRSAIVDRLRREGCRITKQRKIILDIILQEEYSCCKEIYYKAAKQDSSIGIATVYRMINTAAKRTCFLHRHCIYGLRTSLADSGFLRTKTLSIIPYSLASCAVIQ